MTDQTPRRAALGLALLVVLVAIFAWLLRPSPARTDKGINPTVTSPTRAATPTELPGAANPKAARAPIPVTNVPITEPVQGHAQPGTIAGVVISPLGLPLPGATCSLIPDQAPQGLRFGRRVHAPTTTPIDQVVSDAKGHFELSAPDGYWTLRVEYDGLKAWTERSVPSGSFRTVAMQEKRLLRLHVVNSQNEPIPGAKVSLLDDPYSPPNTAQEIETTNERGIAELSLEPGPSWYVKIAHPAYINQDIGVSDFGDSLLTERTVTLESGIRVVGDVLDPRTQLPPKGTKILIDIFGPDPTRTLEIDALGHFDSGPVFPPDAELEITAQAPGYAEVRRLIAFRTVKIEANTCTVHLALGSKDARATGRAVTGGTHGLPAADLFLQPLGPGQYCDARDTTPFSISWRPTGETSADGRFEIRGLKAEYPYQLLIVPRQDFIPKLVRIPAIPAGERRDLGEIELVQGANFTGVIRNADGTPAVHLQVWGLMITWADRTDPDFFPSDFGWRIDRYTNEEGRFEFDMLGTTGEYEFRWGGSYDSEHLLETITFKEGERFGPRTYTLPRDDEMKTVAFQGLVQDSEGNPVDSILVEVWEGPDSDITGEGFLHGDLTEADGVFSIALPPNKTYWVTATDLRGRFEKATQELALGDSDETVWIPLTPQPQSAKVLEGTVTDASGAPLEGIAITLRMSPLVVRCNCLNWTDTTDDRGHFSFGRVMEGQHQIAAVDPTGALQSKIIAVEPGAPITILMDARAPNSL